MSSTRIEYIDRLKGFAILCVIMGHYVFHVLGQSDIIAELIGSFQMPLFFFLSGYVVSLVPTWKKCGKKVVNFMLPMIWVGIAFAYFSHGTITDWVKTPFKYGYWYLYVLSVFYCFLCIMGKVGKGNKSQLLSAGIIFIAICGLDLITPRKWNDIFSVWMIKQYWLFFVVGHLIRRHNLIRILTAKDYVYSISLIGYVVGFFLYYNGCSHLFYINAFLFIVFVTSVFLIIDDNNSMVLRTLSYFGKNTMDIYLFHFFLFEMTKLEMVGSWFADTGNVFIEVLSGILYSVIAAFTSLYIGKIVHLSSFVNYIIFGSFVKQQKNRIYK